MAENYVTNQYSFESRESYEQTKKEAEQIKKLIHSADLKNPTRCFLRWPVIIF